MITDFDKHQSDACLLEKIFRSRRIDKFLNSRTLTVSQIAQIKLLVNELRSKFKSFIRCEPCSNGSILVHFDSYIIPARVVTFQNALVSGIRFGLPRRRSAQLEDVLSDIRLLGDNAAAIVSINGTVVNSFRSNALMSVGSAFKLEVLEAYINAVISGRLSRDEIHLLRSSDQRPPSGILLGWPDCTPMTLETLAILMVSVSDNTATDILLSRLGLSHIRSTEDVIVSAGMSQQVRWRRSVRQVLEVIERLAFSPYLACNLGPLSDLGANWTNFKGGSIDGDISFAGVAENGNKKRVAAVLAINGLAPSRNDEFAALFLDLIHSELRC